MSDWSCGLPEDLLASILQHLSLEDCIRFGAVCVAWRSLVAERGGYPPSKLPWLLLPWTRADKINGICNFYSLSDRKEYKILLPGVRWSRCLGSSNGWLIIIHEERFEMCLLNPLTRSQIRLPSLKITCPKVLEHMHALMVAASWSSVSSYTVVFVMQGTSEVTFVRAGDESWTVLQYDDKSFYNLVHHKGLFYIHDCLEMVCVLDLTGHSPNSKFIPVGDDLSDFDKLRRGTFELVQSSGDLFQLFRISNLVPPCANKTIGFEVFKLDPSGSEWIEANTFGNQALFLSCDSWSSSEVSMSLSAHDFPGLKGSCIYFDDEYWSDACDAPKVIHDMRVFDLEDGSIKTYYPHDSQLTFPIPIWFVPNLS